MGFVAVACCSTFCNAPVTFVAPRHLDRSATGGGSREISKVVLRFWGTEETQPESTLEPETPADLLEELIDAYDEDGDGILNTVEVERLQADIAHNFSFTGEVGGLPKDWFRQTIYRDNPDSLAADHARALQPRVLSVVMVGASLCITVWLSSALARRVASVVDPAEGGALRDNLGSGPRALQRGWQCMNPGDAASVSGDSPCYLTVRAPASEADFFFDRAIPVFRYTANGMMVAYPRLKAGTKVEVAEAVRSDSSGKILPSGLSGTVEAITSEGDGIVNFGVELQRESISCDNQSALKREPATMGVVVPGVLPSVKPMGAVGSTSGDKLNDDTDDLQRAYRSVRDFKKIEPGDAAYVPMDSFRGSPEVKEKLQELVDLLGNPGKYEKVGAVPPKGVLFCGEPGTGKTFAARAVASAAGVPFLAISGSDFRQSPFSGVGTSMTLKMFEQARNLSPCIIFIDEIDSLAEARRTTSTAILDAGELGGSVTRDQDANLNALLAKMDGFEPHSGVLFLAATNRPEVLDAALLRSGRFDSRVEFRLPNLEGRQDILQKAAERFRFAEDDEGPNLEEVAKQTPAFSPADLQTLLNKAATAAVRADRGAITAKDVDESLQEARKSKSKVRPEGQFQVTDIVDVTFADVRGHDEAVEELRDVVDAMQNRERYEKVGAKPPRGVLLEGPPGVGKTHCARALAGEVGLPFLSASGSDFQASRFAGAGITLVKKLFEMAKKLQPCILFIDEVDALGRRRDDSARGAEQDRENTLMQLLVELDGFEDRTEILLVAATNRSDVLDPALMRPGRLDRRVCLEAPDQVGRRAILDLYAAKHPLQEGVDLDEVARRTVGFTGADIQNLINEAALLAAKRGADDIARESIYKAADRVSLGAEKANPQRSQEARELVAVHEAGHAVLGAAFAEMTQKRLARVSIRPRAGGIGGVTIFEPISETDPGAMPAGIFTKRGCIASLCVSLGGRVAEEVCLPHQLEVSSGASGDFREASKRAMAMVTDWGLASESTILSVEGIGRRCSDATLREHEVAAATILRGALESARSLLAAESGRRILRQVSDKLLQHEQCDADELLTAADVEELRAAAAKEAEAWTPSRPFGLM